MHCACASSSSKVLGACQHMDDETVHEFLCSALQVSPLCASYVCVCVFVCVCVPCRCLLGTQRRLRHGWEAGAYTHTCSHETAYKCLCALQMSPGYAEEIKTWLGGWGMDGLLASRGFVLNGVINGIDTE